MVASFEQDLEIAQKKFAIELVDFASRTIKLFLSGGDCSMCRGDVIEFTVLFNDDYPESKPTATFSTTFWSTHRSDPKTVRVVFIKERYDVMETCAFLSGSAHRIRKIKPVSFPIKQEDLVPDNFFDESADPDSTIGTQSEFAVQEEQTTWEEEFEAPKHDKDDEVNYEDEMDSTWEEDVEGYFASY